MAIALLNQRGSDRHHIQVLDRALAILDVLSETTGQFTPAELSTRLPLHKSPLHRAGPVFRITDERLPDLARLVVDASRDFSLDLGYSDQQRTPTTARRLARNRVRSA